VQVSGKVKQLSVAADGTLWAVSRQGEVYTRDDVQWTKLKTETPFKATTISVGSKTAIWAVDDAGLAWRYTGVDWAQLGGSNVQLTSLSVGDDGACWAITKRRKIVRWSVDDKKFVSVPGKLAQIAVGKEGDVWGVSTTNKIFKWDARKKKVCAGVRVRL
jgi:virginiamycin B lyase